MTSRKIKLTNDKLKGYLEDNTKLADEINKIVEEWKKTDEYVKKLSTKMERIKEKIRPIVAEEIKKATKLEEFDMVAGTKLNKGQIEVEIIDQIELYKDTIRKQRDEQSKNKQSNNEGKTGEHQDDGKSEGTEKKD